MSDIVGGDIMQQLLEPLDISPVTNLSHIQTALRLAIYLDSLSMTTSKSWNAEVGVIELYCP